MSYLTVSQTESADAPFRLERFLHEEKPGRWLPGARLVLTERVRESGLLRLLDDEGARTLLAVLASYSDNGALRPTVPTLAAMLGLREAGTQDRLRRLGALSWRGEPLLMLHPPTETGLEAVTVSPHLVNTVEGEVDDVDLGDSTPLPADETEEPLSVRERVIAHSRERYARPRDEVERDILRQLGHTPEETEPGPRGDTWRRLSALGIPGEQVRRLIETYPLDAINDQMDWLPLRGEVRNRARYVVAAIEGVYEPPARIRLERAIAEQAAARETDHPEAEGGIVSLPIGAEQGIHLPVPEDPGSAEADE